jgi:phage host-nuclease inhibitor protein Gam
MGIAVSTLFALLLKWDNDYDAAMKEKDAEIAKYQNELAQSERNFRQEISTLYKEVQDFREAIYNNALKQYAK